MMEKKPTSHIVAGVITGLVSIVLFLVFYFMGQTFKKDAINYLPSLLLAGLIIYFIVKWSNDKKNYVTFGQCFGYGFKASMIMTLMVFLFTLAFVFSFPDFKVQFMDTMRQQMNTNKDLTDDQRSQALQVMDQYFMITVLGGGLFVNLLYGAVASIIGAAVAKKKPIDPFAQQQPQM